MSAHGVVRVLISIKGNGWSTKQQPEEYAAELFGTFIDHRATDVAGQLHSILHINPEKSHQLLAYIMAFLALLLGSDHAHPQMKMGDQKPGLECVRKLAMADQPATICFFRASVIRELSAFFQEL